MTDTTLTGQQIGSVVSLTGSVWATSGTAQRSLTQDAPVYEGEEIVTESDSNVEIKFADGTVLGQGEDSAVRLDDYVFAEENSQLDFHMVKGVMRVVSGEIVKINPEGFNLSTPLATIGIRGTEVMVQVDNGREIIGVDQMGEGHTVLVSNAYSEIVIDRAGMFSGVDFDGSLIAPDEMPQNFISTITRAAPLTILGDPPRSPGDSQDIIPPAFYETIDNQTGEYQPGVGMEYAEEDGTGDEGGEEEFEFTEEELEALLGLETAAGPGGTAAELGEVIDVTYAPPANDPPNDGNPPLQGSDYDPPDNDQTQGDDDPTVPDDPEDPQPVAEAQTDEPADDGGNEPLILAPPPAEDRGPTAAQPPVELIPDSEPIITVTDTSGDETNDLVTATGTISVDFGLDSDGATIELAADDAQWNGDTQTLRADNLTWKIALTDTGYEFTQLLALDHSDGDEFIIGVQVIATDGNGTESTGAFTVLVNDDGPEASDAVFLQTEEDSTLSYNVISEGAADLGLDGGTLTAASMVQGTGFEGDLSFNANGTITYIPVQGETGTVVIDYTVTDTDGDSASAQLAMELAPDSAPTISVTDISGSESDAPLTASGTIDIDFGADAAGATITLAANGALWDSDTRTLAAEDGSWDIALTETGYEFTQYDPFDHSDAEVYVIDVSLTATDGDGSVATGDFSVEVDDTGPTATDAEIEQAFHSAEVSYNVFSQGVAAQGYDGAELTDAWMDEADAFSGDVDFDEDGTITYTPAYGEEGTVTIHYTVEDSDGDAVSAALAIDLNPNHIHGGSFDEGDISTQVGNTWVAAMASSIDGWQAPELYQATTELAQNFQPGGDAAMIEVWKAGHRGVHDINGTDNGYFIEVDYAGATDSIYQTFQTEAGTGYSLTFDATITPDAPMTEELIIQVWDNDTLITEETCTPDQYDTSAQDGWTSYTIGFEAQGNETRIVFTEPDFGNTGNSMNTSGVLLDNVAVAIDPDFAGYGDEVLIGDYMPDEGGDVFMGGHGDDTYDGAQGRDLMFGTDGEDSLSGGNSKDVIFGGDGDDTIDGGRGNDSLIGGLGDDVLTGGQGNDTFVFTSLDEGVDTITDFKTARDQIELHEATFDLTSDTHGTLVDEQFATVDAATFSGGYDFENATSGLIYASEAGCHSGALYYDPNDTLAGDEVLLANIAEECAGNLDVDDFTIT